MEAEFKKKYDAILKEQMRKFVTNKENQAQKEKNRRKVTLEKANKLNMLQESRLGDFTRINLWPSVKYLVDDYREDSLESGLEHLQIESEAERKRVTEHVLQIIEEKLAMYRNNRIGDLKEAVWGKDKDGNCKSYHASKLQRS
jgi:hypothetical protein